jgi:hypothetical protein
LGFWGKKLVLSDCLAILFENNQNIVNFRSESLCGRKYFPFWGR